MASERGILLPAHSGKKMDQTKYLQFMLLNHILLLLLSQLDQVCCNMLFRYISYIYNNNKNEYKYSVCQQLFAILWKHLGTI